MITIIDYGLGNIKAFVNVYKRLNMPFAIATKADDLRKATKVILPGVGSFDHAMTLLQKSGMRKRLEELILCQKLPVLGICVGMQMLSFSSEEGDLPGLGWFDGVVKKFDISSLIHRTHLPHMGWNIVSPLRTNKLFQGIEEEQRFYFLHSYYFKCNNNDDVLAVTDYGVRFSCAINSGNIYGVQFHPEKSHQNGIQILKNFGNL